jgi:hypothetical protein
MSIRELIDPADQEYVWYIGDPVATVGLWRREDGTEFPVYQQTRGQAVFNSRHADESNIGTEEPTTAFFDALRSLNHGDYDPETDDGLDVEGCEWYEVEFLNELLRIAAEQEPPESVGRLFAHAQVRGGGGDE